MKRIMADLFALQRLQLQTRIDQHDRKAEIEARREMIPGSILMRFDRLRMRGKKGVAVVRDGVCGECHIKVAIGTLGALASGTQVQTCGNCGRYLYLPEEDLACPMPSRKSQPTPMARTALASVG